MKTLKAFSLIELMVSLITISCIAAAFSPIISKKLSMSSIMVSKPSGGSGGDSSGTCPLGQYMSSTTNTCTNCSDTFPYCTICTESGCLVCKSDFSLYNGKCEISKCPENTVKISADGKEFCVTQYNIGDSDKFPADILGVDLIPSTSIECQVDSCCWQGETSSSCNSENGSYSGCNRTVCTQYAAEILCNNLTYGGLSWRLPTKNELAGFDPDTNSKNKGASGLLLCDSTSGYGSARCSYIGGSYDNKRCEISDSRVCNPYYVWSSTLNGSSYVYTYYLSSGSWKSLDSSSRQSAYSVRCVSNLTCASKFGPNCTDCSDTACTTCKEGYAVKNGQCTSCSSAFGTGCTSCSSSACTVCSYGYILKDGQCIVSPCPANTLYVKINDRELCITQYNMGDKTEFPVDIPGVYVVSAGSYCGASACCWQGQTSGNYDCDSNNGGYSGCNRTVCNYNAAKILCSKLNYGGLAWSLPGYSYFKVLHLTYSQNKGTSGLMLCARERGHGSAYCGVNYYDCEGTNDDNDCYPHGVWSGSTYDDSNAWCGDPGWNSSYSTYDMDYGLSVRCVANIGCMTKFGSNCIDCSSSACTACKSGYVLKNGKCVTCSSIFGIDCTECTSSACTACTNGYVLNEGQCIVNPCPVHTIYIKKDDKKLCVTQYNMGDKAEFPINVSGVNVVSVNTSCTDNACCWQGQTSPSSMCNSNNGGYSGCNRTVCTQYAAIKVCDNLHYGGLTWRLPTSSELFGFSPVNNSMYIGTSGLMLCSSSLDNSSTYCGYGNSLCYGSQYDDCDSYYVWSGQLNTGSRAYAYYLSGGSWRYSSNSYRRNAFSVRCVSEL